jgi:anti-sigma regulatory factor (Ser/Thr protein kinase)
MRDIRGLMSGREPVYPRIVRRVAVHSVVRTACEDARLFADAADLSANDAARLCIIVEEIVTNIFEHGGSPFAEVSLELDRDCVHIALVDAGKSFDPRSRPMEPATTGVGGGAGLALVRGWAKVLGYDSAAGRNRLELLMPLRT